MEQTKDYPDWWDLSFVGQKAAHTPYVYHIISEILLRNPQVKGIVELGTYQGALTMYLGLWAARLGVPVLTFNITRQHRGSEEVLRRLGITYIERDVFASVDQIREFVTERVPTYLVCDDGNKPREVRTFAPVLPPGSIISAHDWGTEIVAKDVECVSAYLDPFMPELWDRNDAKFATWTIRGRTE